MRIPPSVIVMSLVTAVPFGLAIRSAVSKPTPATQADEPLSVEEYQRQTIEDEKRAEKARKATQGYEIDRVIGKTPMTFAGPLDAIVIGEPLSAAAEERARGALKEVGFDVQRGVDGRVIAVTIGYAGGPDLQIYDHLSRLLSVTWGLSIEDAWTDATAHRKAMINPNDDSLRVSAYLEPEAWVASLPFDLIGKSGDVAKARLGTPSAAREGELEFQTIGLDTESTTVKLFVENDKVDEIEVSVRASDRGASLREALTAKLGPPKQHGSGADIWFWSKPRVELVANHESVTVTITKAAK